MTTVIESFFKGNRTATLHTEGAVITLSCHEDGQAIRGQCFTSNPLSYGPERAREAAERWVGRR